jgi:hypothetical protein
LRKTIYILFLGLIISCNSNKQLEGTWIGTYSYSENDESFMNLPIRIIAAYENDQYFVKTFKYDYLSENDLEKGTYKYKWNKLIHKSAVEYTNIIESINSDSLIFKGLNGSNNSVLKKLNDSLKNQSPNIQFKGKRFLSKSAKNKDLTKIVYDTINFINDTLLIISSYKGRNSGIKWERFRHNKFDILFLEMDMPAVIRKEYNGKIYLTGFYKNIYDIELTELK